MISVIIHVYNEKESVAILHAELISVLEGLGEPFEIIFIDDGSTDDTISELKKLTPVRIIAFTKNFGKSQALQAGFKAARGDYIFTMDGDLQDDPHEIPRFLNTMGDSSVDLVCGWKQNRLDGGAKLLVSKMANGLTRYFTGTAVHDMNCCFKLYRKTVVQSLDLYGDMHRYIPALVVAYGFRITELPIKHNKRSFGVSKYGNFRRFSKSFFDFVTLLLMRRFVDRPMHFFGIMGTFSAFCGALILVYLAFLKIVEGELIGSRPLLLLGVLLVVIGIQLFSSGFLAELLIRQNPNRSMYTLREVIENT